MGRLTDQERARLKQERKDAPARAVARIMRKAQALEAKRKFALENNLVHEMSNAREDLSTAKEIDRMIMRGETGFNGVAIRPMGVEKYRARLNAASRKLDSITGQYDADED